MKIKTVTAVLFCATAVLYGSQHAPPSIDTTVLEKKIHSLVNEQRTENGLPNLDFDDVLAGIAREHSRNMAEHDFFAHENPQGEEPADRVDKQGYRPGVDYETVGENIFETHRISSTRTFVGSSGNETREVRYRTVDQIAFETVKGWMKSPGHRRNILSRQFNRQGIGVVFSGKGDVLITELFLGVPPS